ncbi:hypothetical protein C9374_005489 [Naegleria lovaniensis]|uniref:Uncharacterized protein n=1 Tax=Naegleria lovaniensis TaxID=51637 RepID=A0AA88GPU6_NAELO|nr:uncharacterized protein C9374_005489 [Naegleria lovaniensis]KAG2382287.1 hypothetical protein C9374_005489 [Naegleria lovaniensis]
MNVNATADDFADFDILSQSADENEEQETSTLKLTTNQETSQQAQVVDEEDEGNLSDNSVESDGYSILRDDSVNDLLKEIDSLHQQPIGSTKSNDSKSPKPILKKANLPQSVKHVNFPSSTTPPPPSNNLPENKNHQNKENKVEMKNSAMMVTATAVKSKSKSLDAPPGMSIENQKQIEKLLNENCDLKLELTALKRELQATKKQQKKAHKHYKKVESDYQTMKQNQSVLMEKLEEKTSLISQFKKQTQKQKSEEKFVEEAKKLKNSIQEASSVSVLHANYRNKTWDECTLESNSQLSQISCELTENQTDLADTELKTFTLELIKELVEMQMTVNDLKNNIVELGIKKEQDFREWYATNLKLHQAIQQVTHNKQGNKPMSKQSRKK